MTTKELAIPATAEKKEANVLGLTFDLAKNTEDRTVDLIKAALANPVVGMVAAVAAIEALQGVYVWKGKTRYEYHGLYDYIKIKEREPLISQSLATWMESVIITTEGLQTALQGSQGGLLSLLGLLLK